MKQVQRTNKELENIGASRRSLLKNEVEDEHGEKAAVKEGAQENDKQ